MLDRQMSSDSNRRLRISVQVAPSIEVGLLDYLPPKSTLRAWARTALKAVHHSQAEITLRVVDASESAALNEQYRHKTGPTNVLSFHYTSEEDMSNHPAAMGLLGDLVICASVVAHEAQTQGKSLEAHWAHMVVHGILHLSGHDHEDPTEALQMETLENKLLMEWGFEPPFITNRSL